MGKRLAWELATQAHSATDRVASIKGSVLGCGACPGEPSNFLRSKEQNAVA